MEVNTWMKQLGTGKKWGMSHVVSRSRYLADIFRTGARAEAKVWMGRWCEQRARKFETGILGAVPIFPTSCFLCLGFGVAEGAGARSEEF